MKSKFLLFAAGILSFSLFVTSCATRMVTRIDPATQIDINGTWNNTDSRLTAEEMTNQILNAKWLNDHLAAKGGKKPVVVVGMVTNKSHEHIEAETFMNDLERAFIQTSRVGLVQSGKKREEMRAEKADPAEPPS